MRNYKIFISAACAFMLAACTGAKIDGTLADAPSSKLTVRVLDMNKYTVLDTLTTSKTGSFSYHADVKKGQPEFIYLYYGDVKVASLLLQSGDRVKVTADTLGQYSVIGSEETEKLIEVERDEAEFANKMASCNARLTDLDPNSDEAAELRRDLTRQYIAYYRSRVQYIMQNSHSLTAIPVLYQNVNENLPVFSQQTDAIHFRNVCDSLSAVYPDSKYVKALEAETKRRENILTINARLQNAGQSSYPDLELPDISGNKVKLSEVGSSLIMIYFWSATAADQKMMNLDVVKPLYEKYHDKGFEIYAVSLDTDKTAWASIVRSQKLSWINVCDGKGSASPVLNLYNLASIPTVYFIHNGNMVPDANVTNESSLRRYVESVMGK